MPWKLQLGWMFFCKSLELAELFGAESNLGSLDYGNKLLDFGVLVVGEWFYALECLGFC